VGEKVGSLDRSRGIDYEETFGVKEINKSAQTVLRECDTPDCAHTEIRGCGIRLFVYGGDDLDVGRESYFLEGTGWGYRFAVSFSRVWIKMVASQSSGQRRL
jgi:hypothetical protein